MKLDTWKEIFSLLDAGGARRQAGGYYAAFDNVGRIHREGGPAIVYINGMQCWYRHGKLHRDDGPAIIYPSGETRWYHYGRPVKAERPFP